MKKFLSAILAVLLLWLAPQTVEADVIDVVWDGGYLTDYSSPFHWSPQVVPNNGNGSNTYRATIGYGGPSLDIDATVDALTMQPGAVLTIYGHSFRSAFTRNDTSRFALSKEAQASPLEGIHAVGTVDLGVLANFNPATSTLEGGTYSVSGFSGTGTLSFQGARVVTNAAGIRLWANGKITDEHGNDALQPLAVNDGVLELTSFETAGDFTNNGELNVLANPGTTFIVTGKLTNFDPKTKTLTGGRYVLYDSGFNGSTTLLQFRGADIVTNAADIFVARMRDGTPTGAPSIVDEFGNDALRNFANNAVGGRITFYDFAGEITTTARRVTNAGYMNLYTLFNLPIGGVFEQFGGELEVVIQAYPAGIDTHGGSILLNGGRLTGGGTLTGHTTNNAVISPGDGNFTPKIVFSGNLTLGASSVLRFDVAGTSRAPGIPSARTWPPNRVYGYDAIDCTGSVALDGQLQVSLSTATSSGARFIPAASDTFVLIKSQAPIVGSFQNVANGQRLRTTDGGGSFLVGYGANAPDPTAVVLSDFQLNTGPAVLLNISTRGQVGSGERVLIGGFIITGSEPKPVILHAIGPSLRNFGVAGALDDPMLALHDSNGATIASNDDWQQSPQRTDIQATGIPPSDAREAAIVATLAPGTYTAVLEGKNGGTGVGLVEVYDLNAGTQSQLVNISTRGYAERGENALIGGVIIGGGTGGTDILVRALGPSLRKSGVTSTLADPYLYLTTQTGSQIDANDDWRTNQAAIQATGIPPTDDKESALVHTFQPGAYTAAVSSNGGGVGLIEFYKLR